MNYYIKELEKEIKELQRWKDEMMLVESRWDVQKVARLLDMNWGDDIRQNIEPKIVAMKEKMAKMEEVCRLALELDTSQTCDPKNLSLVVLAHEALKI